MKGSFLSYHQEVYNGRRTFEAHLQEISGRSYGRFRFLSGDQGQRVHHPRRSFRLRQIDDAAYDCRSGGDFRRRAVHRKQANERRGSERQRHRDGVPELCSVSAYDRVRQHGVRSEAAQGQKRRDQEKSRRGRQDPRHRASAGQTPEGAFRRSEAACRPRPCNRPRAARLPA